MEKAVAEKKVAAAKTVDVALTPKQQQVLDIVVANAEGINPKGIGLAAGQEDAKAASWATGALKKLLEENLVQKSSWQVTKLSTKQFNYRYCSVLCNTSVIAGVFFALISYFPL